MLDLLYELQTLIDKLHENRVSYALCGGLALAVHGFPRATVDIDILVPPDDISNAKAVAGELGFQLETQLTGLAGGEIHITRMTKFYPGSEDFVSLDILHAEGALRDVWLQRETISSDIGELAVLSPTALISMKRLRGSSQDMADIERLQELDGES